MPDDRDTILAFIERMGFNPRDPITWDGLQMLAMTAWDGCRLVGAIPLEPRVLCVGPGRAITSIHETVVAVDPAYRNGGLGSAMQRSIAERPPAGARIVTVFREEPASPAYRWYLKNGFSKAIEINAWFCEEPNTIAAGALPQTWGVDDPSLPWDQVDRVWRRTSAGRVDRATRGLQAWLAVHPYRRRYSFHILGDSPNGFALLGAGAMHSATIRADVLELMPTEINPTAVESLLRAIASRAAHEGWHPVRLPLAGSDSIIPVAQSLHFQPGRSFDLLIRPLGDFAISNEKTAAWRYSGVDYI
ncbi:MAG TPA: GNAT family N-acetyltransferase [Tepidisphaeraceae bacterium]|nr:GNAT family N-acetyltransferase [Tepidisphaeraceae bacterium]